MKRIYNRPAGRLSARSKFEPGYSAEVVKDGAHTRLRRIVHAIQVEQQSTDKYRHRFLEGLTEQMSKREVEAGEGPIIWRRGHCVCCGTPAPRLLYCTRRRCRERWNKYGDRWQRIILALYGRRLPAIPQDTDYGLPLPTYAIPEPVEDVIEEVVEVEPEPVEDVIARPKRKPREYHFPATSRQTECEQCGAELTGGYLCGAMCAERYYGPSTTFYPRSYRERMRKSADRESPVAAD